MTVCVFAAVSCAWLPINSLCDGQSWSGDRTGSPVMTVGSASEPEQTEGNESVSVESQRNLLLCDASTLKGFVSGGHRDNNC